MAPKCANVFCRKQLYRNRSSRKIDSQKTIFKRIGLPEKTLSLSETQFSRKTYFYTIGPCSSRLAAAASSRSRRTRSPPPRRPRRTWAAYPAWKFAKKKDHFLSKYTFNCPNLGRNVAFSENYRAGQGFEDTEDIGYYDYLGTIHKV